MTIGRILGFSHSLRVPLHLSCGILRVFSLDYHFYPSPSPITFAFVMNFAIHKHVYGVYVSFLFFACYCVRPFGARREHYIYIALI